MKLLIILSTLIFPLSAIANNQPDQHKDSVPHYFAIDQNNDGTLSKKEVLKHFGPKKYGRMDRDNDNYVSRPEYANFVKNRKIRK